jgi:hypothetical protein
MLQAITEFPKDSFQEASSGALVGKEGYPVEILSCATAPGFVNSPVVTYTMPLFY